MPSQVAEHVWWQRVAWYMVQGQAEPGRREVFGTEDPFDLWGGEMGTGQWDNAPCKAVPTVVTLKQPVF